MKGKKDQKTKPVCLKLKNHIFYILLYCPTTVFGQIFLKKVVKSLQIPSVQAERKYLTSFNLWVHALYKPSSLSLCWLQTVYLIQL